MAACRAVTSEVDPASFWGDHWAPLRYTGDVEAELVSLAAAGTELLRRMLREELASILREELGRLGHQLGTGPAAPATPGTRTWLTPVQIATELGIAVPTVWSWIRSGALAASQPHMPGKRGHLYFVHRETLDAFLKDHVTTAETSEAVRPAGEAARILGRLAARPANSSAAKAARTTATK
jgi:hypothetical protein